MVSTLGFNPKDPGSSPGGTYFFCYIHISNNKKFNLISIYRRNDKVNIGFKSDTNMPTNSIQEHLDVFVPP